MSVTKTEIESGVRITYGDKSDLMTFNEIAEVNKVTALNMNEIKGAINNASSIMAEMLEEFNSQFASVATRLAKLEYVPIAISAFSIISPATSLEVGSSFNTIDIKYTLNEEPTKVELLMGGTVIADITSAATDVTKRGIAVGRTITANTTFTLRVTDGETIVTKDAAVRFYYKMYYGVSSATSITDPNVIKAFSSKLLTDTTFASPTTITVSGASTGKYIWIAFPDGIKTPVFFFDANAIAGGAGYVGDVNITSNNQSEPKKYKVYRSDLPGLGGASGVNVTIKVTGGN